MGERKEVRKEEGVAHFEFWIKSLLQWGFSLRNSEEPQSSTIVLAHLAVGRGRPVQDSDSDVMTEVSSVCQATRPLLCSSGISCPLCSVLETLAQLGWTGGGVDEIAKGKTFLMVRLHSSSLPPHLPRLFHLSRSLSLSLSLLLEIWSRILLTPSPPSLYNTKDQRHSVNSTPKHYLAPCNDFLKYLYHLGHWKIWKDVWVLFRPRKSDFWKVCVHTQKGDGHWWSRLPWFQGGFCEVIIVLTNTHISPNAISSPLTMEHTIWQDGEFLKCSLLVVWWAVVSDPKIASAGRQFKLEAKYGPWI
jgi:hypothetical protein